MKKHILFPLLSLALAFSACNDDNAENVYLVNGNMSGLASEYALNFDRYGSPNVDDPSYGNDYISFTVKSNVAPVTKVDQSWVTVTKVSTTKEVHTFNVTVAANPVKEERTATITVLAGDQNGTLTVSQAPGRGPVINAESNGMTAIDIAKNFKAGFNIGNTLEAPDGETSWGQPMINQNYINGLKAAGFNFVRIPCAWDSHAKDGVIDPVWLDRVDEVVDWVISAGMYAIVNAHWDNGWLEENINWKNEEKVNALQKAYWTQIAEKLNAYDEHLMFAATNEPNAISDSDSEVDKVDKINILIGYQKTMIDAVRSTGGVNTVRTIIVQGPSTNIDQTMQYYSLPEDSAEGRLMAEVHYYDPYQFTLMEKDESWGKVQWFWGEGNLVAGSSRNASSGEADMQKQFAKVKAQFVDNGIPVVLGEYGAYPNQHLADQQTDADKAAILKSRVSFYNCVNKYGVSAGILPFAWDTGELIDRSSGSVLVPEIVNAIIEGASSSSLPF